MEIENQEIKCSPSLAKTGTGCDTICITEDGFPCGHPAIITCDHGSWCSCSICITVCPASWEEWMVLGEPRSPGCGGDCSQERGEF